MKFLKYILIFILLIGANTVSADEEELEKDAYGYEDTIDIKTIINLITKALEN